MSDYETPGMRSDVDEDLDKYPSRTLTGEEMSELTRRFNELMEPFSREARQKASQSEIAARDIYVG